LVRRVNGSWNISFAENRELKHFTRKAEVDRKGDSYLPFKKEMLG